MRYISLLVLVLIFAAITYKAQAAECAPRLVVTERLKNTHGESVAGLGVFEYVSPGGSGTSIVEVWRKENETWTIVQSFPDGVSCVMAHGSDWTTPISTEGSL